MTIGPCLCGDPYCKRCFPGGQPDACMKECPECEGSGSLDEGMTACKRCEGSGEVEWDAEDYAKAEAEAADEAAYYAEQAKEWEKTHGN